VRRLHVVIKMQIPLPMGFSMGDCVRLTLGGVHVHVFYILHFLLSIVNNGYRGFLYVIV